MRRIAAFLVALVILAGYAVPAASAAGPPQPKVVIIVGPVAASTASYKADGDAAYAEARKYTSNVFKVYTPNATWAAAKKALQGASVVIYMGHGNGFPSPYRSSPWPYSQNGLGLNPKAGGDNSTTKYYGEYYLARDVDLAPNAIVVLNHLCYASGNSESGKPKPTLSQAKQRVDNMAAGWLRAGARAVVAEAHYGPAWYVRQLFTTHKTVGQIFADSPTFNGNAFTFPSSRTAGATAEMDPDGTPGGYWRSVTGWLDTRTDDITGAAYADTGIDPTDFVVPGAASVGVDEGGVFAAETLAPDPASGLPSASLPRDTRLRLLARSQLTTATGDPILEVATLDGATTGWMSGADLVPRDSASPVVWSTDDGDGAFSPNGDASGDTYRLTGRISETADWTVAFEDEGGDELASRSGTGGTFDATWDGIVGGLPVADGTYGWQVTARDDWGNPAAIRAGTFRVDTVAPSFDDAVVAAGPDTPTFSPNGDGDAETIAFPFSIDEQGYVDASVRDADGTVVRSFATRVAAGPGRVAWDGLDDAGHVVRNGVYTVRLAPRDLAGNVGPDRETTAAVYKTLSHVAGSKTVFFPQDLDKYAKTTRFSFDLSVSATVDGTVTDDAGNVVLTMFDADPLGAGTHVFDWDGRLADGTMAPRGTYTAVIRATDGELATSGRTPVVADGFKVSLNDTTPGRGQAITLYATSPELLTNLPRVKISQSGTSAFSVTMTRLSSTIYKVTIKLKSTGSAGTVRFSLSGTDGGGKINRASRTFDLH